MQFLSAGAKLLEDKINIARQRMFLFSDDIVVPDENSSMLDVINKINASRCFCATVNEDLSMDCVRASGWKNNRLYYNYVPAVLPTDRSIDTTSGSKTVSLFDVFTRFYSIGNGVPGNRFSGTGTLLETLANPAPVAPLANVMVLPAFDGTAPAALYAVPNTSLTLTSSRSWNTSTSLGIVTGRHSETVNTFTSHIKVSTLGELSNIARSVETQASTQYSAGSAVGPRLIVASYTSTNTVTRSPYSDTITANTTTNTYGPRQSTTNISDANLMYSTGSKADTQDYSIEWGMMPISGTDEFGPIYAIIVKADEDFTQEGLTTAGVKPSLSMNAFTVHEVRSKFIM